MLIFRKIQHMLNYGGCKNPNFVGDDGLGKIGTTGFLIGLVGGFHLASCIFLGIFLYGGIMPLYNYYLKSLFQWCTYVTFLCAFHFLEFFTTALYQTNNLSYDSFIVNHSTDYTMAAIVSFLEYWIEVGLGLENWKFRFIFPGIAVLLVGQTLRTIAMVHCGSNFSHIIMSDKSPDHQLVTTGIYKYLRHPSYCGWFWWSLGTQVCLGNPISLLGYAVASWLFFRGRIPHEEQVLLNCYGNEYRKYAKSTYLGIPFLPSNF